MGAVHGLVTAYASAHGISTDEADRFFTSVQSSASLAGGAAEFTSPDSLMYTAVRLWTSAKRLRRRELCAILNEAIRSDKAVAHAAMITQAINAFCVTRRTGGAPVRFPPANRTFRGGALPRMHRTFFQPGTRYRAPMFIATSFNESVSINTFLTRLDPASAAQQPPFQEPVLWTFHFDGSLPEARRCVHVNFIDRTDGTVHGEDEFLFAPYSCFTVRAVHWDEAPIVDEYDARPHRIDVEVAPDNRGLPKNLPLAPWC